MRFLIFFHLFLYIAVVTQDAFASDRPLGILVQVKNIEILDSKEFKALINKSNLTVDRFYSSLNVHSFKLHKKYETDLKALCDTIAQRFSEVLICELNLKLSPQSSNVSTNINQCSPLNDPFPEINNFTKQGLEIAENEACDLFNEKQNEKYKSLNFDSTLTPLWAQEYSGIDLLKREMSERKVDTSNTSSLLEVWDGHRKKHGEYVANLISGPHETSLIYSPAMQGYINLDTTESVLKTYNRVYINLKRDLSPPRFINNSMGWYDSSLIKNIVHKLAKNHSVVFITTAGNDYSQVEKAKRESSHEGDSIIVTSHAPNGLSSQYVSFAPEVDISAPSDNHILSYDHDGAPFKFNGTSGAAPLVTSSLLAFELITGVELSTPQFKEFLKKTAIRHRDDPARKVTGAGYLNTYKMGAIAFKLVELCKQFDKKDKRDTCMLNALETNDLYDFSTEIDEDEIINNFESAFPKCGKNAALRPPFISCDEKREALKELRKAAFLMPDKLVFWDNLACLYSLEGLSTNAAYYSRLARGRRIVQEEIKGSSMAYADLEDFFASNIALTNNREFLLAAVKNNPRTMKYASESLRNDQEFILAAVKVNGEVLIYTSEKLKKDRKVILAAVIKDGWALEYATEKFKKDREVVFAAVKQNGWALEFAYKKLQNDREIVLAAVKQSGFALQFASEELKNDREVVLEAIKNSEGWALRHASEKLQNDPEVIAAAKY